MTLALSVGILVAAALGIWGHYTAESRRWLVYVFRPLTGVLIVWLALLGDRAADPRYYWAIAAGLLFALVGDILLMLPRGLFVYGLLGFAVTHVCFLYAFTSSTRIAANRLPFVLFTLAALALVAYIWSGVGASLRVPVIVYVALLVSMASQAWSRHLDLCTPASLLGAAGGTLFLSSDAVLSVDRFKKPFGAARLVVLATFYVADWLIARSVGG